MAKPKIKLRCETRSDFSQQETALKLLSVLEKENNLKPDRVSHSEPINQPYTGPDALVQDWWGKGAKLPSSPGMGGGEEYLLPIMLKRSKSPPYWAKIEFGEPDDPRHGVPGSISLEATWNPNTDYSSVLRDWCEAIEASFGTLHIFADTETGGFLRLLDSLPTEEEKDDLDRSLKFFRAGLFQSPITGAIPNLGWATFISNEKLQEIAFVDIDPAHGHIDDLDHGKIFCVNDNIGSVIDNFPTFSRQRDALKSCFPADSFMIKDEPLLV